MFRKTWVLAALSVLTSTISYGQTGQGQTRRSPNATIHGRVIIEGRRDPDIRMEVRLERDTGQPVSATFVDAAGGFEFRGVGIGHFYVSVNVEGYEPVRQGIDVFSALNDNGLTIFLAKAAPAPSNPLAGLDAADPDIVDISQMRDSLPRKAVQDYEKAIEENQKGRTENAIKLLEEAIAIAPNFFHAHNRLAILYLSGKRYDDAEREFKSSCALNPKSELPLLNLGRLYIQESAEKDNPQTTGRVLDQALDVLEQAVRLNPHSAKAYFLLGQANYRSSFLEEAENAFKRAVDIDPNLWAGRLMLANVYVRQARWPEVLDVLNAYLKDNPNAADRTHVEAMRDEIAKKIQTTTK